MIRKGPPERADSRTAILDAADAIAAETGAGHVTLDAVAGRAGVSKGGLLYNFPSKDALFSAMVERYVGQVRDALEAVTGSADANAEIRALIAVRIEHRRSGCPMPSSMAAVLSERPDLLSPVRDLYTEVWETARKLPHARTALLAWLAFEGLTYLDLMAVSPLSGAEREQAVSDIADALKA